MSLRAAARSQTNDLTIRRPDERLSKLTSLVLAGGDHTQRHRLVVSGSSRFFRAAQPRSGHTGRQEPLQRRSRVRVGVARGMHGCHLDDLSRVATGRVVSRLMLRRGEGRRR